MKLRVAFTLFVLTACGPVVRPAQIPAPEIVWYKFIPPDVYQQWADEVVRCVDRLAALGDTTFSIDIEVPAISHIVWLAVPSEHTGGTFLCPTGRCVGFHSGVSGVSDTIALSAQLLGEKWLVKHEVMHIRVKKDTETDAEHGRPWGFCEFAW